MIPRQSEHQQSPTPLIQEDSTLAFLLTHELQQAFVQWDAQQPAREGLHASSVLESDSDFCTREHILADTCPGERQQKEQFWKVLAMFVHGWAIHKKWQEDLLLPTGLVVCSDEDGKLWEIDVTHIDPATGIHFSPDAIIKFAGLTLPLEIKGINHDDFAGCEELYRPIVTKLAFDVRSVSYEKAQDKRSGIVGATLTEAMERNKSIRGAVPQLNLYLHLLGLIEPPNNKGIILVEDKNTQDFMLWVHTYDPEMALEPVYKAHKVQVKIQHFHETGTLPSRICNTRNDARAKRCPFRDACFNRSNGDEV